MQYNTIPNTDLKVSPICLGTWVFGSDHWSGAKRDDCIQAAQTALSLGINFIDTAPIYGNGLAEQLVGEAIKTRRDQVILATKCGLTPQGKKIICDLKPLTILKEIDASLQRLKTDYIDLYQCHWPDPNTPIEITMETLLKIKEAGKIRYIGVSNFETDLLDAAMKITPIVSNQVQYSLLHREIEKSILPHGLQLNVGILAYGPLGGGILSGKYKEAKNFPASDARSFFYHFYQGDKCKDILAGLENLKQLKKSPHEIAINWVRQQPGVTSVLVGARNSQQVKSNFRALSWTLSAYELDFVQKQIKP